MLDKIKEARRNAIAQGRLAAIAKKVHAAAPKATRAQFTKLMREQIKIEYGNTIWLEILMALLPILIEKLFPQT